MSYYDHSEDEMKTKGIDYDLYSCLESNAQSFVVEDIDRVLAVWEGENDEEDWRWVIRLNDGRFVFLQGGCDYTGWDCQSWASSVFAESPEAAAHAALGEAPVSNESNPMNAGLGHMINVLSGTYNDANEQVYRDLLRQIEAGKAETWREKKDDELGL